MSTRSVLAIFDFDKTLITKDSFRLFSMSASNNLLEKAVVIWLAVICKLGWISNDMYKARVLKRIWMHKKPDEREKFLTVFCSNLHQIENSSVVSRLNDHLSKDHHVAIMSASPEFYLQPFIRTWSHEIAISGTRVEFKRDRVLLDNLYGEAKYEKARLLIKQHQPDNLVVYTDHFSDLPIINLATEVWLVSPSVSFQNKLHRKGIEFKMLSA